MSETWQVVLAGEGGQGLIVGGRILARAAIIEGKNVLQTQSYGISARGGYSEAQVVISEDDIYNPKCDDPDLVLALTQEAYNRYHNFVRDDCLLIYEKDGVIPENNKKEIGFPFNNTCLDIGDSRVINILFLGVILKSAPIVKEETLVQAVKETLPPKIHDINIKALNTGLKS